MADPSDFEAQRLANIAERDALLKKLTQQAHSSGLYTAKPRTTTNGTSHKKRPAAKKVKRDPEPAAPRRTSSRLAGIQADSEVAKRKADDEYEAAKEVELAKRVRVTGELKLGDIVVNGKIGSADLFGGTDVLLKGVARPYERTFGEEEIKTTSDKELKGLRERMSGLELWDKWEPNRIKITPERVYSMGFHPVESKPLVFAGDKLGNLGIVDASQAGPQERVKEEEENEAEEEGTAKKPKPSSRDTDESDDEDPDPDPIITTLKPHTRTISSMHSHPSTPTTLYTASYDSSIRALDLSAQIATETYGPADPLADEPVSGIDMSASDPHVVYFTTLHGAFCRHDTRAGGAAATTRYQLSEKKIGGFSLHPALPHYVATASLDRTLCLWDQRQLVHALPTPVGAHTSRLSVSHAAFNAAGQVATSSYDDTIKIHAFGVSPSSAGMGTWPPDLHLDERAMSPDITIRHNNQTGRWVTILKPQWQRQPPDGQHKLAIGNMNRFVDVFAADGTQLAQLGGHDAAISAVPAVAVFHPTRDWVAGGTASGKLCLWM